MKIVVNGEEKVIPRAMALTDLLGFLGLSDERVAVEVNRDVVPRVRWQETSVGEMDKIEIIHFVGGG